LCGGAIAGEYKEAAGHDSKALQGHKRTENEQH